MNYKNKNSSKTWGAWRYYSPAYLCNYENSEFIDREILNKMMELMSFKSIQEFNKTLCSFPRGEIPLSIQKRIKNIFISSYTDKDIEKYIRISEGCVKEINEEIILENPFVIAQDAIQPDIEFYSAVIEDESSMAIRAGISSSRLFMPKKDRLTDLCDILIENKVPNENKINETIYRSEIKKYLNDQNIDANLADDNEFLSELYQQIIYMADCMCIHSRAFTLNDDEFYFWLLGEEEFGFN